MSGYYLAVDIGASSGRHILGHVEDGKIILEEIYRFPNGMKEINGHLCWDTEALFGEIINGMKQCKELGKLPVSMGIDTWAVDFVLLDKHDAVIGDTVAYRDNRTEGMEQWVGKKILPEALYRRTGIQFQPFNTIYQLAAIQDDLEKAETLLMIPDYFHFRLTGTKSFEYTNASSTGLLDAEKRDWDRELLDILGYPQRLFPALSQPGSILGTLSETIQAEVGFNCQVVLPATHDTGSAFMAVPAKNDRSVYLSSGTWSLLGVENTSPITTETSRHANFTNEGGYGGTYRYLKNIMGLWMIQEIRREVGTEYSFQALIDMAEAAEYDGLVDVNDSSFLSPASMVDAVKEYLKVHVEPEPKTIGDVLKCVYRSLALCYKNAIAELSQLTDKTYTAIHIVGGGSNADYLNRLTAEATGLTVYAGPTEGTALGNLMAQMIAADDFPDLQTARNAIYKSFEIKEYES